MLGESFHVHVTESFTCTTALAGTKRRPGTGVLFASSALTRSCTGSGLLKYQLCASPPFLTSCVGGPGGSLPPPPPPHAAAKRPTSTTPRPVSARLTGTGTAGRESPR